MLFQLILPLDGPIAMEQARTDARLRTFDMALYGTSHSWNIQVGTILGIMTVFPYTMLLVLVDLPAAQLSHQLDAEEWYGRAAEAGNTEAMVKLGDLLAEPGQSEEPTRKRPEATAAGDWPPGSESVGVDHFVQVAR